MGGTVTPHSGKVNEPESPQFSLTPLQDFG